jgi:haloacetate dehalogenase
VVAPDLRGYGDSDKPVSTPDHITYAKRTMAADMVAVMWQLDHERFDVVGHDRGGRVGHRMALDHPETVASLAVLDIVPTLHAFDHADAAFGIGYYHWFFLTAPNRVPEALLESAPESWIRRRMEARRLGGLDFDSDAMSEYVRCFSDPATIHATCEDYRAAATIDLEHDREDRATRRRLTCPLFAAWGSDSFVGRTYDVLAVWQEYAETATGRAISSDHYLAEEAPKPLVQALQDFWDRGTALR